MKQIDLKDYKNIFLQTAKEYVDSLSSRCARLTNDPKDKEALANLYISSHSLKSQSQLMGFGNMTTLCENIEKISKSILDGNIQINNDFIALLRDSIRELRECLGQIKKENKERDFSELIKKWKIYQ